MAAKCFILVVVPTPVVLLTPVAWIPSKTIVNSSKCQWTNVSWDLTIAYRLRFFRTHIFYAPEHTLIRTPRTYKKNVPFLGRISPISHGRLYFPNCNCLALYYSPIAQYHSINLASVALFKLISTKLCSLNKHLKHFQYKKINKIPKKWKN